MGWAGVDALHWPSLSLTTVLLLASYRCGNGGSGWLSRHPHGHGLRAAEPGRSLTKVCLVLEHMLRLLLGAVPRTDDFGRLMTRPFSPGAHGTWPTGFWPYIISAAVE